MVRAGLCRQQGGAGPEPGRAAPAHAGTALYGQYVCAVGGMCDAGTNYCSVLHYCAP
jgi:hypothetical protein